MPRGHPDFGHGFPTDNFARIVPLGRFLGQYTILESRTETENGRSSSLVLPPSNALTIITEITAISGAAANLRVFMCNETQDGEILVLGSTGPMHSVESFPFWIPFYSQVYTVIWELAGSTPEVTFSMLAVLH